MTIGDAQCEERWRELKAHTQTLGSKLCLFPCSYVTVDTAVCPGERKIRARDNTEGRGYGKGMANLSRPVDALNRTVLEWKIFNSQFLFSPRQVFDGKSLILGPFLCSWAPRIGRSVLRANVA